MSAPYPARRRATAQCSTPNRLLSIYPTAERTIAARARTVLHQSNDTKGETINCPTDGTRLEMSERSGIEIDYCPECRGVWLDRGELDKIIEKDDRNGRRRDDDDRLRRDHEPPRRKKKSSFLSELFEGG